MSYLTYL